MLLPDPEPRAATYLLISVDDHVIEPADIPGSGGLVTRRSP